MQLPAPYATRYLTTERLQALQQDPGSFADLEKAVHHAFQQMADQLVAGLLAQATQPEDFAQVAKKK